MTALRIALYQPDIPGNHRHHPQARRLPGPRRRHHRTRRLRHFRPQPEARRHGLSGQRVACPPRQFRPFRGMAAQSARRLVLASTKAAERYTDFAYRPDDILLFGRESAGVPETVHDRADARVIIPMVDGQRSINVAMSAAMIAGEAMRQTG